MSYKFMATGVDDSVAPPEGRWSSGRSIDGRGESTTERMKPMGEVAEPDPASEKAPVQRSQMGDGAAATVGSFLRTTERKIEQAVR